MIKCMECGFETNRLQWTHFKFKCTGRFVNCKEYQKAYPNAPLVSEELAKNTGITLSKMIEKYGVTFGQIKWDEYRKKQAESNSFEYKNKKHGWSRAEYDEFNSSRAQTLEKMIFRYGENEGTIKWQEYCSRQAYTNSKEYFVNKYGITVGTSKFLQLNKQKGSSSNPILLAKKLGIGLDEAVTVILNRVSKSGNVWGSNPEKEFTSMLVDKIGPLEYTTFTRPYGLWSNILGSYVIYDIKHKDCVIEFNGDYWHANPQIYQESTIIRGKSAKEIQDRDYKKLQTAKDMGLRTLTIWESEFKLDKEETIRKVIEWMQNGLR